jgi:hypothetical protein
MADDNGPPMTITMVVCTVVSFIFMSLRFYCKQSMSTKVGLDDAILALSWVRYLFFFFFFLSFIHCQLRRREPGTRTLPWGCWSRDRCRLSWGFDE